MKEQKQYCRVCGCAYPPRELSQRGICGHCGKRIMLDAIRQMQTKYGPLWEKWRRNYIAAMDGVLNNLRKELQEND